MGGRATFKPTFQFAAARTASSKIEKQRFLFVNVCTEIQAVQREKYFHGRVGDPLVAVDERVIESSEYASAAALPVMVGCRFAPSNVARGCATADSSAGRSRSPVAPPCFR